MLFNVIVLLNDGYNEFNVLDCVSRSSKIHSSIYSSASKGTSSLSLLNKKKSCQ